MANTKSITSNMMKNYVSYSMLGLMVLTVAVVLCQVFDYMNDLDGASKKSVAVWAGEDPQRSAVASAFIRSCMGGPRPIGELKAGLYSIYDCAIATGGDAFAEDVRAARESVRVPSPLRWLSFLG